MLDVSAVPTLTTVAAPHSRQSGVSDVHAAQVSMRKRYISTAAAAALTAPLLLGAGTHVASAEPARAKTTCAGVCAGIRHCRVVAFKDVDGDGRRDHIGYAVPSNTRVVIRVKTARGHQLTKRLRTPDWPGGAWLGAARIDGRRGVEPVVGTSRGAHAELFTVITYRNGELVRESVPGPGHLWVIDAAVGSFAGVWRRLHDGRAVVTLKSAERTQGWTYEGENRRYVWRENAWRHRATVQTTYHGYQNASRINGWHVRGLPTWPAGQP